MCVFFLSDLRTFLFVIKEKVLIHGRTVQWAERTKSDSSAECEVTAVDVARGRSRSCKALEICAPFTGIRAPQQINLISAKLWFGYEVMSCAISDFVVSCRPSPGLHLPLSLVWYISTVNISTPNSNKHLYSCGEVQPGRYGLIITLNVFFSCFYHRVTHSPLE